MIFGFGKKKQHDGSDDESDEVDDVDFVLFQGALNGKEANLNANARLAQAGLIPAKEIITDALSRRCEQLRIEPKGERAVVQLMVDGVAHAGGRLSKPQGHAITQMMKLLSGLDVQQRQRPQAGGLRGIGRNKICAASSDDAAANWRRTVDCQNPESRPGSQVCRGSRLLQRTQRKSSRPDLGEKGDLFGLWRAGIWSLHDDVRRAAVSRRLSIHRLHGRRHARLGTPQSDQRRPH